MVKRVAGFPVASAKLHETHFKQFRSSLRHETQRLKSLPGAAHIVLHKGRCVFSCADGWANLHAGTRFRLSTICALHGATKPIVVAAFLTLVDEGKVRLTDPVAKFVRFPEAVAVPNARHRQPKTKAVKSKATLQHLLSMTAGLDDAETVEMVRKDKIADLAALCEALADTPFLAQPGTRYDYGFTLEVIGRIIEKVSGQSLEHFVKQRILKPLGMNDTYFTLPPSKLKRKAILYDAVQKETTKMKTGKSLYKLVRWRHPDSAPSIISPGGGILSYNDAGMYSTVQDYARFCQMLLDDGVGADGRRLLRTSTMKAMWRDGLAPFGGRNGRVPGWHDSPEPEWAESILGQKSAGFWDRNGWSMLNTHLIFKEPPRKSGKPRQSETMWMGGGGGAFWAVDKRRRLAAISMSQCFGGRVMQDGVIKDGFGPLARDVTSTAFQAFEAVRAS